ncbi:hypothetical protein AURDEDRAFT_123631 [Auricularia subglabra TFB-10046 SS5]|nr:hypothetical protein AURDEDRAFT_123631 [Auricularia subglabra TFB-10046 SS5]
MDAARQARASRERSEACEEAFWYRTAAQLTSLDYTGHEGDDQTRGIFATKGFQLGELEIIAQPPLGLGIRELEDFLAGCRLYGLKKLSVRGPFTLFLRPELEHVALRGEPLPDVPDVDALPDAPRLAHITLYDFRTLSSGAERLLAHARPTLRRLDISSLSLTQLSDILRALAHLRLPALTHLSLIYTPLPHVRPLLCDVGEEAPFARGALRPLHALRLPAILLQHLAELPAAVTLVLCGPGTFSASDARRLRDGAAQVEMLELECEAGDGALEVLRT